MDMDNTQQRSNVSGIKMSKTNMTPSVMRAAVLTLFGLLVCGAAVVKGAPRPQDGAYTTKYDNINVEEVLRSDRLLNNYVKCLMDEGPCTPEATEFKRLIPDALNTECIKCSDVQKDKGKVVLHFILQNKPDIWLRVEKKYDPTGAYRKKYDKYKSELTPEERANIGIT